MQERESNSSLEKELQRQLQILQTNVVEITPLEEFKAMLRKSLETKTPLRVKCGIDPNMSDIHLGHLVPYRKMRVFQDLGHIGVVIIGDYTAQIGDPSGKNETRPTLTAEQVKKNAETYMEQVFTVLDRDKTQVRFQSEWFTQTTLLDLLSWASTTTVAKLFSHETFRQRYEQGSPLALHELIYPVLQGIDSVFVQADVELGGSDQKFNVLMGRDYQKIRGQRPQVAILLPLIRGLCGTQKMSKSLGNYIGVKDAPFDKFGKIMSIPDELMVEYYQYLAFVSLEELHNIKTALAAGSLHPNECKKQLATMVVSFFHGEEMGQKMRQQFESVFARGELPDELQEFKWRSGITTLEVLVESQLLPSNSEARRMLKQNAVSIVDGEKLVDGAQVLTQSYVGKVFKVGKRKFLKLV